MGVLIRVITLRTDSEPSRASMHPLLGAVASGSIVYPVLYTDIRQYIYLGTRAWVGSRGTELPV